MIIESLQLITTEDNQQVAVWQVADDHQATYIGQNVLMIHGAFSDKRILLGIARYLAQQGYHCYIMEWRGHGASPKAKADFNLETVALYDVAATFDYLFNTLGLSSVHCITHSGGGMCLTMFLIQHPTYIDKVNSISMFACQAFGAALTPKRYARVLMGRTMTKALGYLPAKRFGLGSINESYFTMKQWFNWNLHRNFASSCIKKDGQLFDYKAQMPKVNAPIYSIAAAGDVFIAPPSGCQLYLDSYNNRNNQFREFGVAKGDLDNYNHGRIMMSQNAAKEVWPTVLTWIKAHSG
ncbi:MAG: alpha/beta fold hydrolase [Psychrobacter sp.]|nr:alpha/beta fold hydrolase [Psychrobacter sp.]